MHSGILWRLRRRSGARCGSFAGFKGRINRKPIVLPTKSMEGILSECPTDKLRDGFFWASCEFSAVLAKHAKQICVSHGFKGSSRFCWVRTEISMPNKLVKSSWALFWGLGLVNLGLTLVVDSLEEHVCCDVAVSLRLLMVFRLDLPIFDTWTKWETASLAEWLFWRPEIRGDDLMGRTSRVSSATAGSSLRNVSDF